MMPSDVNTELFTALNYPPSQRVVRVKAEAAPAVRSSLDADRLL